MTDRLSAVVETAEQLPAGVVHLSPESSIAADVVRVRSLGGRETVARLGVDPVVDTGAVRLSTDLSETLAVDDGETVVVEPTTAPPAATVTVAPVAQLSISGGESAVREALADRPLTVGDRLSVSLLNGTFDVPLRVTATEPDGAVTFDSTTDLELVSGPAPEPSARRGSTPVPPSAVGGYDETISTCRSAIVEPLRRADAYHVDGSSATAGVVLHGQRGVGKTHLLRHAAWLADAEIVHVDAGRLATQSADAIDDAFEDVVRDVTTAPSTLVHVDGLDALSTDDGTATAARVDQLAKGVEQLNARDDAVVVGETHDADGLADALVRGGRLSRHVSVPPPSAADRAAILAVLTRGVAVDSGVDLEAVAERTLGYVAADLVTFRARWIEAALARSDATRPRLTTADAETALTETTPSAVSSVGSPPSTTFDDIGGLDDVKRELVRAVEWPLAYPDALDRLGVDTPAGILLYGPPGTGKTMLARAVASTTDANFLTVNGPELLNKYVGESERRVRQLFDRARDSAPCVVFFDEIDALGGARGDDGDSSAPERVVSQLLTELDGLTARERVTVIGATNRPDRIDEALTRPGRFDRVVEVPLPDAAARREIFRVQTRGRPFETLDVDALVRETDGYSGSDIAAILQEASLLALEERLASLDGEPDERRIAEELVVRRHHVVQALDRTEPSLSPAQRERYASFGDAPLDAGSDD